MNSTVLMFLISLTDIIEICMKLVLDKYVYCIVDEMQIVNKLLFKCNNFVCLSPNFQAYIST